MPTCDLTARQIKRLLIPCSDGLRAKYQLDADRYFESGYLRIYALPQQISPEYSYLGDTGYKPTFQGLRYLRTSMIKGYTVKVADQNYRLFALMQEISAVNSAAGALISVLDYCLPEYPDVATALAGGTEPYTVRAGRIYNVIPEEGSVGTKGERHYVGFGFKFQEALVRTEM